MKAYYILATTMRNPAKPERIGNLYTSKRKALNALKKLSKGNYLYSNFDGKTLDITDCFGDTTIYSVTHEVLK